MGTLIETLIAKLMVSGFDRDTAIEIACKAYNPDQPRADNGEFGEGGGATGGGGRPGNNPPGDKPKPAKPRKPRAPASDKPPKGAIARERPITSDKEATEVIIETQKQFDKLAKADPELKKGIQAWGSTSYTEMRSIQQGKTDPAKAAYAAERLAMIDKSFNKLPPFQGQISRDLIDVDPKSFKEGATMTMEAHSSFTARDKWNRAPKEPSVKLVVPKQSAGRAIWGMAGIDSEMEVLVPKGTRYRVAKIVKGKPQEVHLEEVTDGKDASDISAAVNEMLDQPFGGVARTTSGPDQESKSAIDWDWTVLEELVGKLILSGYDELSAIEIATAAVELGKADRERDSSGRFSGNGGGPNRTDKPKPVAQRPRMPAPRPAPSGDITEGDEGTGNKPALTVGGKPRDEQDQTPMKPGYSNRPARRPRAGPPKPAAKPRAS